MALPLGMVTAGALGEVKFATLLRRPAGLETPLSAAIFDTAAVALVGELVEF
jgi:hypothetical protein